MDHAYKSLQSPMTDELAGVGAMEPMNAAIFLNRTAVSYSRLRTRGATVSYRF